MALLTALVSAPPSRAQSGGAPAPVDTAEADRVRARGTTTAINPDGAVVAIFKYVVRTRPDGKTVIEVEDDDGNRLTFDALTLRGFHDSILRADPEADRVIRRVEKGFEDGRVIFGFRQELSRIQIALLILFVLLAAVAAVAVARARRVRRAHDVLVQAQRAAVDSREAERLRIARELHDGPVQDLASLGFRLELAGASGRGPHSIAEDLQEATHEIRAVAEGLRPPALDSFGISTALQTLAAKLQAANPAVTVVADVEPGERPMSERDKLAFYRIAQEAANNALEHAHPRVVVILFRPGKTDRLEVLDDGVGFDTPRDIAALQESGRFGLLGMLERAELSGGTLSFEDRKGGGTRVVFERPHPRSKVEDTVSPR